MRKAIVVAALLSAVALVWLLRRESAPPRAPPRRGLLEGESLVDLPDLPAAKLPERAPTLLTGHVYGPDGQPVDKAEVRVVYPKTFDLVRSGPDGAYELPFDRHGRFLIEAALTIEYAPAREWVEVPADGDPAPLDFHLRPAGAIFGEVTLAGMPVDDAGVELFATDVFGDDQSVHDTSARNGYFNFYFDPPKDVPLKLEVTSDEGLLRAPLRFTWRGEQMNVGRLDLVPYPGLRIKMRLPDGSYAREVSACRPEDLVSNGADHFPSRYVGTRSRVFFPVDHDVTARLVFLGDFGDPETGGRTCMVERQVEMMLGRPRELEVIVRRGPLVVASRLVDGKGEGVRGRLGCGESEAWTGERGAFEIVVPCGGLHSIFLEALEVAEVGWVDLARDGPAHAILLDADAANECEFDLGGRILLLAGPDFAFSVRSGADGKGKFAWVVSGEDEPRPVYLSPPLEPGSYRWAWEDPSGNARWGDVLVDPGRLTVVDVR
ncbi:MAG TPA: carboxypeptidase-like regulatory domain-containing protein [Planctomycetota bacterium]|nr:carboxypeptidase-like regulatory domain-containing protein [Planctomycetota bacterium]